MCSPAAIGMAGVQGASAGANILGQIQQQNLNKQYEWNQGVAQNEQIVQTRNMATQAYINQVNGETLQQEQQQTANANEGFEDVIKSRERAASGLAEGAEGGVTGNSLNEMTTNFQRQEQMALNRLTQNQEMLNQQHIQAMRAYGQEFTNRVTQLKPYIPDMIPGINYLGPVLGIGQGQMQVQNAQNMGGEEPPGESAISSAEGGDEVIEAGGMGSMGDLAIMAA